MIDVNAQAPLAKAARQLQKEAKAHKRSAEFHRQRAREINSNLAELIHECRRLGIDVDIAIPIPAGGTSDRSKDEAPRA